jgi:hypothetical protein
MMALYSITVEEVSTSGPNSGKQFQADLTSWPLDRLSVIMRLS